MKTMIVYCNGAIIADRVGVADTFASRFWGLMGKKSLDAGEGLFLRNCSSIHCFFMKMAIDAVYLSKDYTVLGIETLKPWSVGGHFKKTAHVFELPANSSKVCVGDILVCKTSKVNIEKRGAQNDRKKW